MSRFWVSLAVVLGGALLVMSGVGVAAVEYGAFRWPGNWAQADAGYRNGYVAGVMDTLTYSRYVGVPTNGLDSAWTCQNTKGLTDLQVVKTVEAMLAANPKFEDNIAGAIIVSLEGCKLAAPPTGNVLNKNNTIQKR